MNQNQLNEIRDRYRSGSWLSHQVADDIESLLGLIAEYTGAICFGTSCLSCASILDASYDSFCRAERAERQLELLRAGVEVNDPVLDSECKPGPEKMAEWLDHDWRLTCRYCGKVAHDEQQAAG